MDACMDACMDADRHIIIILMSLFWRKKYILYIKYNSYKDKHTFLDM